MICAIFTPLKGPLVGCEDLGGHARLATCAKMLSELVERGVDCDTLARLAHEDAKACQTRLKELGVTQIGPRMRLLNQLRALEPKALEVPAAADTLPPNCSSGETPETKAPAPTVCTSVQDLRERGVDCDALARLARENPKACQAQLKELGVTQMGIRARLITELAANGEASSDVSSLHAAPGPALPASRTSGPESKLLTKAMRFKELGNQSFKDQNYVAACEAYREGIEAAEAARATAPAAASKVNPVLVALLSNICLAYSALSQYRVAKDSADAALEIDGDHVKARLRRGACLLRLGTPQDGRRGSDEPKEVRMARKAHLDQAKADFLHVVKIEPNNREVCHHATRIPRRCACCDAVDIHPNAPPSQR